MQGAISPRLAATITPSAKLAPPAKLLALDSGTPTASPVHSVIFVALESVFSYIKCVCLFVRTHTHTLMCIRV